MDREGRRTPSVAEVSSRFRERFGRTPDGVWQAPGRVNLIGEHTDYNAGLALPFAIDRRVVVAAARRGDGRLRCISAQTGHEMEHEIGSLSPTSVSGWGAYPLGAVWALREAGLALGGFDLAVDSGVPLGRGLSSSAALTAAVALAVADLAEADLGRSTLASLCRRAEADFVGVPVGLLDPLAVLCARTGQALLIDFADVSVTPVPLTTPMVVIDTGVDRSVGSGAYAERRRQCQEAARRLGVGDLRHADRGQVEGRLEGVLRARARHVVTENQRVLDVVARLRAGRGIGTVLSASHASLRDDFDVSCPELDAVVEVAAEAGAEGARLTGAGFGGCAIAVAVSAEAVEEGLRRRFATGSQTGYGTAPVPVAFAVTPSAAAGRLS